MDALFLNTEVALGNSVIALRNCIPVSCEWTPSSTLAETIATTVQFRSCHTEQLHPK